MLKIYIFALMLASSCELSSCTFLAALKSIFKPQETGPPASYYPPSLPPYPTYKAFVDPNPPIPPMRSNYVPKPYPDYKVSFASPGNGIGTSGIQLTYTKNYMPYPNILSNAPSQPNYAYSQQSYNKPSLDNFQQFYNNKPPSYSGSSYSGSSYSQINAQTLTPQFSGSVINSNLPLQYQSALLNQNLDNNNNQMPYGIQVDITNSGIKSVNPAQINQDALRQLPGQFSGIDININTGLDIASTVSSPSAKPVKDDIQPLPEAAKQVSNQEAAISISNDQSDKNALNIDINPDQLGKGMIQQQQSVPFSFDAIANDFRLVFVPNQNQSVNQDDTEAQSPRAIYTADQARGNEGLSKYVSGSSNSENVNYGQFYTPQPVTVAEAPTMVPNNPQVEEASPAPEIPKEDPVPTVTEETRVVNEVVEDAPAVDDPPVASGPERAPAVADAASSGGGFSNFFPGGLSNMPGLLSSAMGNSRIPGNQGLAPQNEGFAPQAQNFAPQPQDFAQSQPFSPNMGSSGFSFDTPSTFHSGYFPQQFQPYGPMYFQPGYGGMGSSYYVPSIMEADEYGQPEELETMTVYLDPSNEMNIASNQYKPSLGVDGHNSYQPKPIYNTQNSYRRPNVGVNQHEDMNRENGYRRPNTEGKSNFQNNYKRPNIEENQENLNVQNGYRRPNIEENQENLNVQNVYRRPNNEENVEENLNLHDEYKEPNLNLQNNYERPNVERDQPENYKESNMAESPQRDVNLQNNYVNPNVIEGHRENVNLHNNYVKLEAPGEQLNYVPSNPSESIRNNNEFQHNFNNNENIQQSHRPVIYVDQHNSFVPSNDGRQTVSTYIEDIEKIPNYYQPPIVSLETDPSQEALPKGGFNSFSNNNIPINNQQTNSEYIQSNIETSKKSDNNVALQMEEFDFQVPMMFSSTPQPDHNLEIFESTSPQPRYSIEPISYQESSTEKYFLQPAYGVDEQLNSYNSESKKSEISNNDYNTQPENNDFVLRVPAYNSEDSKSDNNEYQYKPFALIGPFYHPTEANLENVFNNFDYQSADKYDSVSHNKKQTNDFIGGRVYPADDEEENQQKFEDDQDNTAGNEYRSSDNHVQSASAYPIYDNAITPYTVLKANEAAPQEQYKVVSLIGPFGGYAGEDYSGSQLRGKSIDHFENEKQEQELVGDYDTIQASSIAPFPKRTPIIRKKPMSDGDVSEARVYTSFSIGNFPHEKWSRPIETNNEFVPNDPPFFEHTSPSENFHYSTPNTEEKLESIAEHFETAQEHNEQYQPIILAGPFQPQENINDQEVGVIQEEKSVPVLVAGPFLEPEEVQEPHDEGIKVNQEEVNVPVLVAGPFTSENEAVNLVKDENHSNIKSEDFDNAEIITPEVKSGSENQAAVETDEEDDIMLPPNHNNREAALPLTNDKYKPVVIAGPFHPKGDDGVEEIVAPEVTTQLPPATRKVYDTWQTPSPRRKLTYNSKRKMNDFYPTTYRPITEDNSEDNAVSDKPMDRSSYLSVEHLNGEGAYGMKIHPKIPIKTV